MNTTTQSEIPMKEWVATESIRTGIGMRGVYQRIARGRYPHLQVRRVNSKVVFVQLSDEGIADTTRYCPTCGKKL